MQWNLFNHVNKPVKLTGWLLFLKIFTIFMEKHPRNFPLSLLWHLQVIFFSCRREIEQFGSKSPISTETFTFKRRQRVCMTQPATPPAHREWILVLKRCRKYFCLVLRTIQEFFLEHTLNVNFLLIFYQNIKYQLFYRNIILLGHRHTR